MFENVKPPEDIFDGVDTGNAPPPAVPTASPMAAAASPMPVPDDRSSGRAVSWKPIMIAVTVFVVVGASGSIAYFMLASKASVVPEEPVPVVAEQVPAAAPVVKPSVVVPTPVATTVPDPEPAVPDTAADGPKPMPDDVDRDKDGLTDSEEAALGTSPTSADTDADGLFDKEEVEVYKTNPLNPDTDGDGYLDGAEVKQGYNPNGEGKLFGSTAP